jgi:hypothetical protein
MSLVLGSEYDSAYGVIASHLHTTANPVSLTVRKGR